MVAIAKGSQGLVEKASSKMPSVTCPFCPLACDDLELVGTPLSLEVACELANASFDALARPSRPRVSDPQTGDQRFELGDWRSAVNKVKLDTVPSLAAQNVSLEEAKRLCHLSSTGKIVLWEPSTPSSHAWKLATARDGFMGATLGEIQQRCELAWVIGSDSGFPPRLQSRLTSRGIEIARTPVLNLDALAGLSRQAPPGFHDPALNAVASVIECGKSLGVMIGNDGFAVGEEILAAEWLNRLIGQWNCPMLDREGEPTGKIARVVSLHFDASASLQAVSRWSSNENLPVECRGATDVRFGATNCSDAPTSPTASDRVKVQIGGADPGADFATVYLPATVPGMGSHGTTIRGDSAVTLPLKAVFPSELPTRMEVLEELIAKDGCLANK